jgi:E1-E2 ATPase
MLTGESIPAECGPGKIAYAGALVRRGEATAEVVATGTRTYFGRTAELVRVAHVETSEQRAVLAVVRNLTIVNFAIVVGMVAYAHAIDMSAMRIIPLVLTALLSAVPVALPATFTLAATLGGESTGPQRRSIDPAFRTPRGGDDRRAVRRQDRDIDRKRSHRRCCPSCRRKLWRGGCARARRTRQLRGRTRPDRCRNTVSGAEEKRVFRTTRSDAVHAI